MRICLVTPFAWSVPHEVNDHVAGVAAELRSSATRSPCSRRPAARADLRAGRRVAARRRRRRGDRDRPGGADLPAQQHGRAGRLAREPDRRALARRLRPRPRLRARPAEPLLPRAPLRRSTIAVASFFSPERLGYPPGKAQREKLLGRIDALVASSDEVAAAAARALPRRLPDRLAGRRHRRSSDAGRKRQLIVLEWRGLERPGRAGRDPDARRAARLGAHAAPHAAAFRPPLRSRAGSSRASTRGSAATRTRARRSSARRRSTCRRSRAASGFGWRPTPPARRRPIRPASRRSRSSRPPPSPGSPRTTSSARGSARQARAGAERQSYAAVAAELDSALPLPRPAPPSTPRRRPARRPAVDHVRPAHAHILVARLLDPGGGAARPRRDDRARRDRGHRPQPLRRRAGGGRARPQPRA